MSYSLDDLALFTIVRDTNALDGTAYFELHPGEVPEPVACWLPGSIFVRDAAFDFLVECFARTNPKFDYFSFERFSTDHLDALTGELRRFLHILAPGCDREMLFSNYSSLFSRKIWQAIPVEHLRVAVRQMTADVLDFVRRTLIQREPLWVLGM